MIRQALTVALFSISAVTASAQELSPVVRERIVVAPDRREETRVNVGINFFMPGPASESAETNKIRERARRVIYEMALRECHVVMEVLARECRLENVNVNVNRQLGPNQPEGYNVNGSLGMRIVLKERS